MQDRDWNGTVLDKITDRVLLMIRHKVYFAACSYQAQKAKSQTRAGQEMGTAALCESEVESKTPPDHGSC